MHKSGDELHIYGAVEAILFVAGEGVSLEDLSQALSVTLLEMDGILERMQNTIAAQKRGIEIFRYGDKVQLRTSKAYADQVQAALSPLSAKTLTRSVLETLSIIAYKQPITRAEIEAYKGVSADYSLKILFDRGLVNVVGRKDTLGRPLLYGTSESFMRYFNIASLQELPPLPEEQEEELTV